MKSINYFFVCFGILMSLLALILINDKYIFIGIITKIYDKKDDVTL